ncbi:MAG: Gfo/Idh/MocA family oxidoreductase [Planctomycetota bacterium]|nr:Gfo/Idh/MocA family oxidoreductase [Planctomycetota bacterium]
MAVIRMAVAGAGDWGRNHVRALASLSGVSLDWVIDPSEARREDAKRLAPGARVVADADEAFADPKLDAVVIASPGSTHGEVARQAIRAKKHLLVEKPLATTSAVARDLVRRADRAGVLLGVGHLLLFHPAVRSLKRAVDKGRLGPIRYIHCQRTNLGRIRHDEGALLSLAPHDLSVMVHLLGAWPIGVSARGAVVAQPELEDVVFLVLRFPDGQLGHVHLSWLDPLKVRCVSVVGERAMAVFDDMAPDDKLKLIRPRGPKPGADRVISRLPCSPREPLKEELRAFVKSVRTGAPFLPTGQDGANVVRILEAAERSMAEAGREIRVRIR